MRVLCVAEKPSIAKSIAQILSGGQFQTRQTRSQFIKNYDFDYPRTSSIFTVTCVSGHLTTYDFTNRHRTWNSCDAFDLFDAPIEVQIPADKKAIEGNLMQEARRASTLMIWTDCDREGEHIGLEIVQVCKKAKPSIVVKRARFSAIIAQQIHNAAQNPANLDNAQADAVEARILLDLRIGAAFTRMQTLTLQHQVPQLTDAGVISYGPCQFPTLGFVVQRYNQVKNFVPEPFWYIYLSIRRQGSEEETPFTWKRGHLFDEYVAIGIYEHVLENPKARVIKVVRKNTKKWKPLPLTTVELQKAGSRLLRMAPKKVLDIAEKLYQQGFLSYPRTETDQFDPQFDFHSLIQKQTVDPAWGEFARSLEAGEFEAPRKGKNNDKAHPPIHPTAHAGNLAGDDKKVYEFIARRFLACCSKDALGWQTTVDVVCGGEEFHATGLVVLEKNYLLVYPYDKWSGHELPEFEEGEEFMPSVCELRDGQTSSPSLLTEGDLVSLMDKNGIGTDATIAQHIQMIIDRGYVMERMEGSTKYLVPSKLGLGLIEGYNQIGLDKSLSKPLLRRETERSMVQVCEQTKSKNDMLTDTLERYKEMFTITRRQFNRVIESVRQYLQGNDPDTLIPRGGNRGGGGGAGGSTTDDDGYGGGGAGAGAGGGVRPNPEPGRKKRGRPPKNAKAADTDDSNSFRRTESAPVTSTTNNRITITAIRPIVNCPCGAPAAVRTITNNSASLGKKYFSCGTEDQCGFFKWADDSADTSVTATTPVVPSKRQLSMNEGNLTTRTCRCGTPANLHTVTKETENKGRKFWKCPNKESDCKFFEWDDEPPRTNDGMTPSGSNVTNECFRVRPSELVSALTQTASLFCSVIRSDTGQVVGS
ncbi:hypothetical protein AMATHDRAFT_136850 [Amanita thiersii Skay4041]|uniref:DNA topoisomerase n=1 Tax=Amanita thiersii Skay4041 TaxID=703135 RepID=A0A2A9NYR8_9AGAR|nr:hypothetical protein AMATHDRAFT_136850 [Amanita thiersii Skay4041]